MAGKNQPGRPAKLRSAAARNKLLAMLRKGAYRKAAVTGCGMSFQTFLNEIERDPEFANQVAAAEDHARGVLEQTVFKAASGRKADWKAAIAYLERKFDEWAKKRPDSISLRKFTRHMGTLVPGLLGFVASERQDEFRTWFQLWLDNVLADDRND